MSFLSYRGIISCDQEQLSALNAGGKQPSEQAAKASGDGPAYLQWRGSTYTVYGDRLKGFISQASEAAPQLQQAEATGSQQEQLSVLERLILAFNEAKGIVRHSIATSGGEPGHLTYLPFPLEAS